MSSLSTQLLYADIDVACPACSYVLWVRMSEVLAQVAVICPCCRVQIRLQDDRGSAATAGAHMEATLQTIFGG